MISARKGWNAIVPSIWGLNDETQAFRREVGRVTARIPAGAAVMQPAVTAALTRALFEEWAERGYAALSLENVAKRAGVGKAALYRRWRSKGDMAGECLAAVGITITEVEDTGSLKGDIRALLFSIRRVLRHPLVRRILPDVHAEIARSPDLRAAVRPFQARRREQVRLVVDRAIARGELAPSVDHALAADLIGAPIYWRQIVTGARADSRYIETLATAVAAAMEATGR